MASFTPQDTWRLWELFCRLQNNPRVSLGRTTCVSYFGFLSLHTGAAHTQTAQNKPRLWITSLPRCQQSQCTDPIELAGLTSGEKVSLCSA